MMRVNLSQATADGESVAHDVMTGCRFDVSLREIIDGLR